MKLAKKHVCILPNYLAKSRATTVYTYLLTGAHCVLNAANKVAVRSTESKTPADSGREVIEEAFVIKDKGSLS